MESHGNYQLHMNEILFVCALLTLAVFYHQCASQRLVSAPVGFTSGIVYFTLFPLVLLMIYGTVPAIAGTRIPGVSWVHDNELVTVVLAMLILTTVSITLVLNWFPRKPYGRFDKLFSALAFPINDRILFALYLVVAIVLFFVTGLGKESSHWATSRNEFMAEQGTLGGILMGIPTAFKYLILFRIMPVLFTDRKVTQNWTIMVGTVLFDLYTSGTRLFLFQFLAVVLFDRLRVRNYRPVIVLALAALPIAALMEAFTVARTHLSRWEERSVASAYQALETGVLKSSERIREKAFYERTLLNISEATSLGVLKHVYHNFGSRRPFLSGLTLAKPIVAWIPRSWWRDKPFNFSYIIGSELVGDGVSVGATSLGEFYGNFGTLGGISPPFFLLAYVLVFAMVCQKNSRAFPYVVFIYGIAVARNGFMECAIPLLISLVALNIIGHTDEERGTSSAPAKVN